ncbi:hypothetical protein MMC20_003245 [Loxospora ochrophaea]|nr:hypothetical protein [Loxospora ochrophaea]
MDSGTSDIRNYYEKLRGAEHAKNELIEELLDRYERLNRDFTQKKLDHERETSFNREVQLRELQLKDELRQIKATRDRDAFVLVLIDGDGMIFDDRFIHRGEVGGKEAAGILWGTVRDYVDKNVPDLSSDYKIVTRVYANLKGLGEVCNRSGILEKPSIIEDFARGFTSSKQLFDFVDVGYGKDRADDKLSELFKLHLYNCHCRQIIFGCSHDNGYARLLEEIADEPISDRVKLLEGVPFERELATLKSKYQTTKFESLFRTSKINPYQQTYQVPAHQQVPLQQNTPPSQVPMAPAQGGLYQSPYQPGITRTPSMPITNPSMNPTAVSWANAALKTPTQVASPPPTPQPSSATYAIPRNRYGQRVDPPSQYDKVDVTRVKKLHMCNVHFLRGDCPYGDECTHDHFYRANKNEIATLRYIARMTPCRFGTECDDAKCIYGHR